MAKKQQIILTHGTSTPSAEVLSKLKLGEVLVQHAENPEDAALHIVLEEGAQTGVSFTSKAYVDGLNATATTAIETLQTTVGDESTGLVKDVAALKKTVGDAEDGLVKDVAALKEVLGDASAEGSIVDRVGDLEESLGAPASGETDATGLYKEVADNASNIEALKGLVGETGVGAQITAAINDLDVANVGGAGKYIQVVGQADGKITATAEDLTASAVAFTPAEPQGALSAATTVKDALDVLNAVDVALAGDIEALEESLTGVTAQVTTLIGTDANKSVRTIANEELAAQLLTGDAEADFNTLQEIARWIEDHPEDAAAMNAEIAKFNAILNGYFTETEGGVTTTTVKTDINSLQTQINEIVGTGETSVPEQIAALKATIDAYTVNGKAISGNPVLTATDINITDTANAFTATTVEDVLAEINTEYKKADEALDTRLETVEGAYVKEVKVNEQSFTPTGNVLDLSALVIDGGTYE